MVEPPGENEDIREHVLAGQLPVSFILAEDEVTTMEKPPPMMRMVSRLSYLPLVYNELREYFKHYAPPHEDELWCLSDGVPLKWHLPFGTLFDLHGKPACLPWLVTVRLTKFPADKLIRCRGDETLQWHFINTVKEAIFLQFGSTKPLTSLSMAKQTVLCLPRHSRPRTLVQRLDNNLPWKIS
jgi:autophagy-related protein 5